MASREDKVKGSLLGLAWGDILGCPVENWRPAEIAKVFPDYSDLPMSYPRRVIEDTNPTYTAKLRALGVYSDDTQQALSLLNVALLGWDATAWVRVLTRGDVHHAWRGTGANFRQAVTSLGKGQDYRRTGTTSAGIGAGMRTGPLGGIYLADSGQLRRVVLESALITHGNVMAAAYAYLVAYCTQALILGESPVRLRATLAHVALQTEEYIHREFPGWLIHREHLHTLSTVLSYLPQSDWDDLPAMRGWLLKFAQVNTPVSTRGMRINDPFVLAGGLHALVVGLQAKGNPRELLADVVRCGDDTDTVAAIAGSLWGAREGCAWIPINRMVDRRRLVNYGEAMLGRLQPESIVEFLTAEARLSKL